MKVVASYSRIIVKPSPKSDTTEGGLYIPESAQKSDIGKGVIVSVSDFYMAPNGPIKHDFKVDQLVFYKDYSSTPVSINGEDYEVVHIDDVEAVIVED